MRLLKKRKLTKLNAKRAYQAIEILLVFSLLISLHRAVFSPVISDYLKSFVLLDSRVAFLEGMANMIVIAVSLMAVHIVLRIGKVRLILLLFAILACVDLLFLTLDSALLVSIVYVVFVASYRLVWFCINLLIKRYSEKEHIHANEGKVYTIGSLGWIIGPALGGLLAGTFGYTGLFLFMMAIAVIGLVVGLMRKSAFDPAVPTKIKGKINLWADIREFWARKEFRLHYFVYLMLYAYYSLMSLYFPLYLYQEGYSFALVGIAVSVAMLPYLLEYPVGQLADKFGGVKFFFGLGFLLMAAACGLMGLTTSIVIATLVLTTRYSWCSVGYDHLYQKGKAGYLVYF